MTDIFVNGCFDCFHSGHASLLKQALELVIYEGAITISLNTDRNIYETKGPGRPVVSLVSRVQEIKQFVNSWCSFHRAYPEVRYTQHDNEEELLDNINKSLADILVHGDDITDVSKVTGYGHIGILIVPRKKDEDGKDISTTRLIESNGMDKRTT